jgi:hypothetical protein
VFVDDAIQVNESNLTVECCIWFSFVQNFKHIKINHIFGWNCCYGKNKIQNKQSSVNKVVVCTLWKLWKWVMKSQLYVPDDVLVEASAARYQMLPKKSKLRYPKELETFTQWQTSE